MAKYFLVFVIAALQILLRQRRCSRNHANAETFRPRLVHTSLHIFSHHKSYGPHPYRYIDADVHHGDGVEEAFAYDRGVFSLSFHRHGPGFFPGTGDLPDVEAAVDDGDDDGAFLLFAFIVIDKMPAFD